MNDTQRTRSWSCDCGQWKMEGQTCSGWEKQQAEITRLREEVLRWRVVAQFTLQAWEDGENLQNAMDRIEEALK